MFGLKYRVEAHQVGKAYRGRDESRSGGEATEL